MIMKVHGGGYLMEGSGLSVVFVRVLECMDYVSDRLICLYSEDGVVVARLYEDDRGFKARIKELKSVGLLE